MKMKRDNLLKPDRRVRTRGNLMHLGLGVVHARVARRVIVVDAQAAQRLGIGLGELDRLGDRRGRKGRRASRGRTGVESK